MSLAQALRLAALPYRRALYRNGGWSRIAHPSDLERLLAQYFSQAERELAFAKALSYGEELPCEFTTFWDAGYPPLLRHIFDPPPILFHRGPLPRPEQTCISIVGTRRSHALAEYAVRSFLTEQRELRSDLCIVSGFARGVDRIAHRVAIELALPAIAVLGSGVLKPGPLANLDLLQGARQRRVGLSLVSEFLPDAVGRRWHFPRRNRIIAGCSGTTFVVQAPEKSGALITARFALEEGRDVVAFDHPILRSLPGANEGNRTLLEDGALAYEMKEDRTVRRPECLPEPGLRWLGGHHYWRG
ncbi:MAG: DNA-protecting protein DprA [Spirochaetales bacterium]|nr:DNA-protecting protein DprA [Spirochaetales bacterium]